MGSEDTKNWTIERKEEKSLEIIGEAIGQLGKVDPVAVEGITAHRQIVAFRNILAHGYSAVDDTVVWDVLQINLPVLRREVDAKLAEPLSD
mgnify:CR=1 FL=1